MKNLIRQYILLYFPINLLYILSQVNSELRKYLLKDFKRMKIKDFEEIWFSLLTSKIKPKKCKKIFGPNSNFPENMIYHKYFFIVNDKFYFHASFKALMKITKEKQFRKSILAFEFDFAILTSLSVFKKKKLLVYLISKLKQYSTIFLPEYVNTIYRTINGNLLFPEKPVFDDFMVAELIGNRNTSFQE